MVEVWRDINGFEGLYQVSNLGRVKSLARTIIRSDGVKTAYKERIRICSLTPSGYPTLNLCKNGMMFKLEVHRLVAKAFLVNLDNKLQVNHKDKNPKNNNVENLEWASNRENSTHKFIGSNKTSQFAGVSYSSERRKWVAQCQLNGVAFNLGRYKSEEEAREAYTNFLEKNGVVNKYAP